MKLLKMRYRMNSVPSIPVTIDEKCIEKGALHILKVVRPSWVSQPGSIRSKVFTDGLSNKLVGFFTEKNPDDTVIVKVFGSNTGEMIDRDAEIQTMRNLHERKCGAELYATFLNGLCYEFMNGNTLEVSDCRDETIYPLVAAEMAHMHSTFKGEINTTLKISSIWCKLNQFNKLAEESMGSDVNLKLRLEAVGVRSGWAQGVIKSLQGTIEKYNMPITFCHNDLIPRNIVYDPKKRRITFIDVEYAMDNYLAFDVANHFLEFAGVPELDYSKCPDRSFKIKWLEEYLRNLQLDDYPQEKLTVEKFLEWVELCTPLSHLMWGLWAIHQAKHSTINFDYVKYVGIRFGEFKKCITSPIFQT